MASLPGPRCQNVFRRQGSTVSNRTARGVGFKAWQLAPHDAHRLGGADLNSVQALLLFNIGEAELTAGELRTRGYYLGSNVSYNLKKLVDAGFISHQRSRVDRRSVRVSLTESGLEVAKVVNDLYNRHIQSIEKVGGITSDDFRMLNKALQRLERFWTDQILYRL